MERLNENNNKNQVLRRELNELNRRLECISLFGKSFQVQRGMEWWLEGLADLDIQGLEKTKLSLKA